MLNLTRPKRKSVIGTSSRSSRSSELTKHRTHILAEPTFARDFFGGKTFHAYIFPSADFWASCLYYFNIYIVNLESDHNFTIFFELIYLYIYNVCCLLASCNWATYPEVISVDICTLVYFSSNLIVLIIKSRDKYQSLILIGLARAEKANSRNRYILVHYRSYWRELQPLVTPWAFCIKEGIEPWKSQKWFNPSHAQVSVSLCSLSSSPVLFCLSCYYYCYYLLLLYLLVKGLL